MWVLSARQAHSSSRGVQGELEARPNRAPSALPIGAAAAQCAGVGKSSERNSTSAGGGGTGRLWARNAARPGRGRPGRRDVSRGGGTSVVPDLVDDRRAATAYRGADERALPATDEGADAGSGTR